MEVEVCQMCGVRGYAALLYYCDVCKVSAEHVYCLDKVSDLTQKVVEWSCEQCVPTYFCNQPILQPSSGVEERTVKQLPDNPSAADASQKILSNPSLGSNDSAYELPEKTLSNPSLGSNDSAYELPEKILSNPYLGSNDSACEFPVTDHVNRMENVMQNSQLNLETSTADTEAVPSNGKAACELLGKTLVEQEAQQDVSESDVQYKGNLENFEIKMNWLKNRLNGLEEIEKAVLEKKSEMRALIANRVATVDAKEQAMLDRVQEQKDIAVNAIMEAIIANRVAIVDAKEQAMLDRVQEQKDIAVDAIMDARNNSGKHTVAAIKETRNKLSKQHPGAVIDVRQHLKLKEFCTNRDAKGFLNYVKGNKNCIDAICDEIPVALKNATEPALFVLDTLKGFYPTSNPKRNTRNERMCVRRSCLALIDSVPLVLGGDNFLDHKTKRLAKAIADDWKSRLDSRDATIIHSPMEDEAFLKLLTTFKITSEFDEEEVYKIVLAISHRRQTPNLCRSLGLIHRIPGIIEVLISQGRQIDAVHFVQAFKLTENFPPVPLVRTYLKEVREDLQKKREISGGGDKQKSDAHLKEKELAALKTVVNCVEEYKLEAQYPIVPLKKRVRKLEKWKFNKMRMVDDSVTNQQRKKARDDNGSLESCVPANMGHQKFNKKRMVNDSVTNQQIKKARVDNGRIDKSCVPSILGHPPLACNMNSSLHGSYGMEPPCTYYSGCHP